jgi:CheY-like chemotaxis protein
MEMHVQHMNHIVLAEDDKDHTILFQVMLKQVDPTKTLSVVHNGEELLEFLSQQVPDIVFLDLNMPCKNGLDCLKEIRQQESLKDLPVVVYSNSANMTDIHKSYLHRADLYMVKPFDSFHLKHALQSILSMDWREKYSNQRYYFINNRFVPFTA